MNQTIYHNNLLIAFVRSNSPEMIVYLKQDDECREYAVKVFHPENNTRTIVKTTFSLSDALREFAETIAQFTDGFSTWTKL